MPLPDVLFEGQITWKWLAKSTNRPVFGATRNDGATFVIKYESKNSSPGSPTYSSAAVGQAEFRRSFLVMAHLHELVANYKHPYGGPAVQFPEHSLLKEIGITRFKKSLKSNKEASQFLNDYLTTIKDWCPFFMAMELVTNLKELDTRDVDDLDKWKRERRGLLGDLSFYCLGKIAAVDLFLGNTDRFVPNSGHTINNMGNIFFSGVSGADAYSVGLDFFDPYSQWMNLYADRTVAEHEKKVSNANYPGGFFQASGTDTLQFAERVVTKVCDEVAATPDDQTKALYASKFVEGYTDGKEAIQHAVSNESEQWFGKRYVVGRGRFEDSYPAYQLWLRADYLGWLAPGELLKKVPALKKKMSAYA